ncbi:hypothetical protein [Desulfuromonas sp. AOP6]|uniref:hypothetical protein n=1 Tax=Desulfuromonas sp. AOP6 TaxID=1566351 RepID=UPI00126C9146|nr:hypothetical protein [Desulfuromonas sp. AOP6]BCA80314.1 hypothetical protein AOP6_2101 [Desulfuromonas sp. AOP6]
METEKSTSRGIRFPYSLWDEITKTAEKQKMQPADFVRQACQDKLKGGIEPRLAGLETRTADRISNIETLLMEKLGIVFEAMKILAEGQEKIVRQNNALVLERAGKQPGQQAQQRPANR